MAERTTVAFITGATSGIGKATAMALAKSGMTVVVTAKDGVEGKAMVQEIRKVSGNMKVNLLLCDLSSSLSIRSAVLECKGHYDHVNILIHCAAVFTRKRIVTQDGLELMFATNHLGPFLLTNLLLGPLKAGVPARIITLTAPSTIKPTLDDLQGEKSFSATRTFGATKAENLLFTYALARKLQGTGITVNACHPGVTDTNLMHNASLPFRFVFALLRPLLRTPARSALGVVALATSPEFETVSGELVHDGKSIKAPFQQETILQERLWLESLKLAGLNR